jgi:hypothetical protein
LSWRDGIIFRRYSKGEAVMNSDDYVKDKLTMIKEMLFGYKEAIYIESHYIMKVEILDIVKDHSLIEIGLGVSHCFELNSFFRDSLPDCDHPKVPNYFTLSGVEESFFLRENRIYVHYVNAHLPSDLSNSKRSSP